MKAKVIRSYLELNKVRVSICGSEKSSERNEAKACIAVHSVVHEDCGAAPAPPGLERKDPRHDVRYRDRCSGSL